jgi:hypothetical protein
MTLLRVIQQYKMIKITAAFKDIAAGHVLGFEQSMQFISQFVDIADAI